MNNTSDLQNDITNDTHCMQHMHQEMRQILQNINGDIIGIGVDIVHISRIAAIHNKSTRLAQGILSDKELQILMQKNHDSQVKYLARCWCAKEAVFKAIPNAHNFTKNAKYIEILNKNDGAPYVNILHDLQQLCDNHQIHISISDDVDRVIAFCIITR